MTAVLPLANTGFTYLNDPNTGMRRTAADTQAISCGGVDIIEATSTGVDVAGTMDVAGAFSATTINQNGFALLPVGMGPLAWSGAVAPSGWLLCYGQAVSRTTYAALFTAIGGQFGNGDGTTTFNVPDMRGRVGPGRDDMGGVAAGRLTSTYFGGNPTTLGAVGGLESHTLTTAQLASHSHINTLTDPGHAHTTSMVRYLASGGNNDGAFAGSSNSGTISGSAVSNTTGISINNVAAGSGNAHNNIQPGVILNYIIFAGV